jgi:hypothetical protein
MIEIGGLQQSTEKVPLEIRFVRQGYLFYRAYAKEYDSTGQKSQCGKHDRGKSAIS